MAEQDTTVAGTIEVVETSGEKKRTSKAALVFCLETLAVPGRKVTFDVLKGLFADKETDLSSAMFMKHCLSCPKQYVPELLEAFGKKRASADKLIEELLQGLTVSFDDTSLRAAPVMGRILRAADGMKLGAITGLQSDAAERLMARLGLPGKGVHLESFSVKGTEFPAPDMWSKLARAMGVGVGACTAIATDALETRSSLAAGMKCVVLPDEFTSFQDFGGADLVLDEVSDESLKELIATVCLRRGN